MKNVQQLKLEFIRLTTAQNDAWSQLLALYLKPALANRDSEVERLSVIWKKAVADTEKFIIDNAKLFSDLAPTNKK